jgi:hypothetical protein
VDQHLIFSSLLDNTYYCIILLEIILYLDAFVEKLSHLSNRPISDETANTQKGIQFIPRELGLNGLFQAVLGQFFVLNVDV